MTPKFELGRDFCTMYLPPKFHRSTFTRSEVIVLTNTQTHKLTHPQTNRCRWKHPTFFATLRRWVQIKEDPLPCARDRYSLTSLQDSYILLLTSIALPAPKRHGTLLHRSVHSRLTMLIRPAFGRCEILK